MKGTHIRTRLDEMMLNQKKAEEEIWQAEFDRVMNKLKKKRNKPVIKKAPEHFNCRCMPIEIEVSYDICRD
jgi:hypothetical protein